MLAAIYVRVSSAGQETGFSLSTQIDACLTYAHDHGYQVVEVFREVYTGADLRSRPELSRMRELVRSRAVQVVIAYDLDRLTRDQIHLAVLIEEAEHADVRIEFVTEKFEDTPVGRFIRSALAFKAELERVDLTERITRGQRARAAAGKLKPSYKPAYGYLYRADRSGYILNDIEVPIVRRLFLAVRDGDTLRGLCAALTAEGVPAPGGKQWHASAIVRILRNPLYAGRATAYRTSSEVIRGKRRTHRNDPSDHVLLPDAAPAIVDDRLWDQVQVQLRRNQEMSARRGKHPELFLLRGIVYCAGCGGLMYSHAYTGRRPLYRCVRRERPAADGARCPAPASIDSVSLDDEVWQAVESTIRSPLASARPEPLAVPDPTGELERAIAETERKAANLSRHLAGLEADVAGPVLAELKRLAAQRRHLEQLRMEAAAARDRQRFDQRQTRDLAALLAEFQGKLDASTTATRRLMLVRLGVRVMVGRRESRPRWWIEWFV